VKRSTISASTAVGWVQSREVGARLRRHDHRRPLAAIRHSFRQFGTLQIDEQSPLIPQEVAQKHFVLPLSRVGASLTLAMVDPTNVFAMDDVKFMTGLNVEPVVVAEASIQQQSPSITALARNRTVSTVVDEVVFEGRCQMAPVQTAASRTPISFHSTASTSTRTAEDVEVVEDNEEIDLSTLSRMSEDAPVVDSSTCCWSTHFAAALRTFTSNLTRKSCAFGSALTAFFTT
jgi:hypothetical protein